MTREDPELGLEKRCSVCGEWWPLDEEFWYFQVRHSGEVYTDRRNGRSYIRQRTIRSWYGRCRACWADRNAEQYRARKTA